jgi:hypothetical protein
MTTNEEQNTSKESQDHSKEYSEESLWTKLGGFANGLLGGVGV